MEPTPEETYQFDLQGFLLLKQVLTPQEVDEANAVLDSRTLATHSMQNPTRAPLHPRSAFLMWDKIFRDLIDHPQVLSYLIAWVDRSLRLDHCYPLFSAFGEKQLPLHHGGYPYQYFARYDQQRGRIFNTLVVVSWALTDLPATLGTFTCIPGSHKASFAPPAAVMQHERPAGYVIDVPMERGDVVIFTEALTHGSRTWRARHQRRTLLYKYAAPCVAWSNETWPDELLDLLSERQRRLLRPAYMHDVHSRGHGFRNAVMRPDSYPLLDSAKDDH
ncbi:phytanoyl-CoA dioxygenase family protein [Nonomuraea sp. NPDC048901]|uniref:phytanoyl-CoA dioxygenase family protein n=1 Tax=Nonomuraea sp. NPDC048901 TaxID=3155627 RepID=UPI003405409E